MSIGKRDTERLLPAVTRGVQRLCKQPDIFFSQKEPVFFTCQPDIKGVRKCANVHNISLFKMVPILTAFLKFPGICRGKKVGKELHFIVLFSI